MTTNDVLPVGRFLEALFPDLTERYRIEVRSFDQNKHPRQRWFQSLDDVLEEANFLAETQDVYFGAAARHGEGANKEGVGYCGALFADADDWQAVQEKLDKGFPPPSAIVNSGRGRHLYWLLKDPFRIERPADILRFEIANKGVAAYLGADNCSDISHVYRVPGTLNHKTGGPYPVELLELHLERRYSLDDFKAYFGTARVAKAGTNGAQQGRTATPWADWVPIGERNHSQFAEFCDMAEAGLTETAAEVVMRQRFAEHYEQGGPGSERDMLSTLRSAYRFVARRHETTLRAAAAHQNGQTPSAGAAIDDSAPVLEEDSAEFWEARPELQRIHDYALAHRASPWGVLGCVLARVVAATPPNIVLPALIGDVASINIFLALVGPSGSGKGAAESTAARFVNFGSLTPFHEHRPGSGQGLAHAYGHTEKEKGKPARMVRHASAALFSLQEADTLRGLFGQQGSTLMPELRSLAMGERLGHLFVDPEKRVEIAAHTYRASLIVGVQPERAGVLLDDTAGGTPQRFLWLPTTYPHPDERPEEPAGLRWGLPLIGTSGLYQLPICDTAAGEIDAAHLARARGDGEALDGHLLLTREKVAAALALLHGHAYAAIGEEEWQLAGVVMDVSAATRSNVVTTLADVRAREDQQRATRRLRIERAIDDDATARAFAAAQRQAVNHVAKDVCGGCKRRCINHAIAGKYRVGLSIDEVIADALLRGYLSVSRDGTTYSQGKRSL